MPVREDGAPQAASWSLWEELCSARLLRDVARESVAHLLERCPTRTLEAEEVLITPGDRETHLYVLLEGRLRVHVGPEGADYLSTLEAGESVGSWPRWTRSPAAHAW